MRTIITCILLLLIAGFNTTSYAQAQRDRHGNTTTVRTHTIVRTTPQHHVYRNNRHKRYNHPTATYVKQTNYISPSKNGYYERRSRNGRRITYVPVGRRY